MGIKAPSLYSHFASKHAIYDAMFGEAWTEFLEFDRSVTLPDSPRAALRVMARTFFDFATADLARHQLMNLRIIPGFTPSEASYAPAVAALNEGVRADGRSRCRPERAPTSTSSPRWSPGWSTSSGPTTPAAPAGAGCSTAPSTCTPTTSTYPGRTHDHDQHRTTGTRPRRSTLDRATALRLAATEYERYLDLLRSLARDDWSRPTDCPAWDVRAMASHNLGMAEMAGSLPEMVRQFAGGGASRRRRASTP